MKLLCSTTYYDPYISGLTLYAKRLAEGLKQQGMSVSVLCMRHLPELRLFETISGVPVIRAKPLIRLNKGFVSFDFILKGLKAIRTHDVVCIHLPQVEGFIVAVLAVLMKKPVIAVYHCDVRLPKGVMNRIAEHVVRRTNAWTLALSTIVVTYTDDFTKHTKALQKYAQKIHTVYPPVVKPKIDKDIQNIIRKKIQGASYVIGIAARLAEEKGFEFVFGALPHISKKLQIHSSQLKLVVAGPVDPVGEIKYKERIMRLVKKYHEQIVFLGSIPPEKMGSFYSLINVLVLPSVNSTESFGMVQVEAMMYGVPVVASDLPGVRIPVKETGMGNVVPIKDSRAIAGAVVDIVTSKSTYRRNQHRTQTMFNVTNTCKIYVSLIQQHV